MTWTRDDPRTQVRHTKHGRVYMTARPSYCDRGRVVVIVDPAHGRDCSPCAVDVCDGFPRYYFDEERAKLEVQAWIDARGWDDDQPRRESR